jgi:hypothetical protein
MHQVSGRGAVNETPLEDPLMESSIVFTMYDEPVPGTLDGIDMKTFHLLLGGGTIDPVNPSLTVVGLEAGGNPDEADILVLELSPLDRRVLEVGRASQGDMPNLVLNLGPLFALMGRTCPSLLLSPTMLSPPLVGKLYQMFFRSRNDGWRLLEGVRLHPNDPFRRVGRELRARQKASGPLEDRRLESREASELASLLLEERAVDMEWKAFILTWDEVCRSAIDADPSAPVMSLKDFLSFHKGLQATCRLKWGK